jgi:hypothetical protein
LQFSSAVDLTSEVCCLSKFMPAVLPPLILPRVTFKQSVTQSAISLSHNQPSAPFSAAMNDTIPATACFKHLLRHSTRTPVCLPSCPCKHWHARTRVPTAQLKTLHLQHPYSPLLTSCHAGGGASSGRPDDTRPIAAQPVSSNSHHD